MKNYRTLARKEVLSQKLTSFLILTAVILSTMMTAAVGQSAGVLSAMRQQQAIAIGGDRYATFVQLTEEKAQMLEKDPRLSYAGRFVPLGDQKLNDQLSLDLAEYWEDGISTRPAYSRLAQGRLPQAPMEIALPEDALQFLGFTGQVGDQISLSLSKALRHGIVADAYDYTAEFTLVGITESNFLGYTGGHILGLAGQGTAKAVLPPEYLYYSVDIRTESKKNFQSVMDDLGEKLEIHELDTLYNVPLLNALGISFDAEAADTGLAVDDTGFSWLVFAGVLVVSLILLAAGLVIYNILKIAVARRLGQYGTLRALGAEKGQLYRIVAAEILYLCMAGIPAGLLLGALSAKGILSAALNQLSPEMFLAGDSEQLQALIDANSTGKWGYLLISAFITLLFAFLAAAPAARFAARVSPVRAMSGTGVPVKRRNRNTGKIRSFERYYARLNLSRSRGRTAVTVLSLVMSITVFLTLQSFLSLLGVSGSLSEHLGDYSIVNPYEGISPKELQEMEADEKVEKVAAQQFSLYELDEQNRPKGVETDITLGIGETFQIFGFNDIWMDYAFASRLTEEQLEQLKAGEGCVIRNPIPMEIEGVSFGTTHVEEGSTVTVSGKKLPVLLSMEGYDGYFSVGNSGFVNGVQVLVSDRIYSSLTGTDTYAELRPGLTAGADRAAFDRVLEEFCRRVPGTVTVSYEQTDRQYEESGAQIRLLAWGLILFIGLIGILNIVNTVYTNIHTRITEIGIQRAMGMSAGSLYRVFLWEGFYYGIRAAVIGCITGYIGRVFVEAGAADALRLTAVPVVPMACASLFAIGACILATCIPLWKISRMSIVDSIELVE
ncbi:ABC transporter permease [bacterium 1xD42-87]|nr:ABC transporter permease [bacterium 1xD42-87]